MVGRGPARRGSSAADEASAHHRAVAASSPPRFAVLTAVWYESFGAHACRNQLPCVRCVHALISHRPSTPPGGIRPMIEQQPTTMVSLTDAAVLKLTELTKEETNPAIGLRVYVYSGGCSGFRYGMMLEDAPTPEDRVLDVSGIKVYVDGQSVDLLKGSQIDYVDTLMGAGFTVNNPNAVAACGCGSSFRTADDGGAPKGCAH